MDYKLYKFRKVIGKVFDKLIETIFYIPAWLYKNSEGFYKFIQKAESRSYTKDKKKYLAKKVFRCLEKQQSCTILVGTDFDNEIGFDLDDISFELLLSDEKWIKRNKLKVEKITLAEYIKRNISDRMWAVRDWQKDKIVFIVSR